MFNISALNSLGYYVQQLSIIYIQMIKGVLKINEIPFKQ